MLHTGDVTHLSKPEEFDTVDQILKSTNKDVFFVPGEHDVLNDDGASFRERYGKNSKGQGWYSFDKNGVHFIGLVNVINLKAGGLGNLGPEQLDWLKDDVSHLKHSTPIVVFAHIPLWTVYPQWGWGTDDSATSSRVSEEVRLRNRFERPHSPDHAKSRRQCDFSYRFLNRLSSTCARQSRRAGSDESAGRAVAERARNYGRQIRSRQARARRY